MRLVGSATLLLLSLASGTPARPALGQRGRTQPAAPAPLPPPQLAAAPLLRLRGGDSAIQAVQRKYMGVPLVTRSWLTLILIFAGLNQVGFVPPEALALDAQAFAKGQFWRPLTAASFLGGLGAQLLQKCYYLIQFGCGLERTLGSGEYLRVLASSTALLCIICNVLGWQFVGDGLVMAITVLTCQQTPDAQVNMYGLNIPSSYLPFAQLCMSYLFTQQIPWMDILGALVGYVHYQINENTKPDSYIHAKQLASGEIKAGGAAERPGARTLGSSGGAGGSKKLAAAKKGKKSALAKKAKSGSKPDGATCGPDGCSL